LRRRPTFSINFFGERWAR